MAAVIYVAEGWRDSVAANPTERTVTLEDDGYYWHLYRYFEGAKVQRKEELIALYGGAEIVGYELDRLEDELLSARENAYRRQESWRVLTGWNNQPSRENEIWKPIVKAEMIELIGKLLWLIHFAKARKLKLICSGD